MLRVRGRSFTFLRRKTRLSHKEALEEMKKELRDYSRVCYRSVSLIKADGEDQKDLVGVFLCLSASPLALLSLSCASDNIFPRLRGGNRRARAYRQECYSIGGTSEYLRRLLRSAGRTTSTYAGPSRSPPYIWSPTL